MPEGQVLVTRESMLQAGARFDQAMTTLQQLRAQVDTSVHTLIGPNWGGSTALQFRGVMQEWDEQYRIVQQSLQAMRENLAGNTMVYDQGDQSAQSSTSTLGAAVRG